MVSVSNKAFTMIELVFVIVIIGILSGIAVPRLAASREDAFISKARVTVGSLRSAISMERQKRILRGDFDDINGSEAEGLLEYGLSSDWVRSADTFTFTAQNGNTCVFSIDNNDKKKKNKLLKGSCNVKGMGDL
jgi:general secretion pathway protein G